MSGTILARGESRGLRMTGQRRVIATVLAQGDDHPDVEDLHARASRLDPGISIATVYRTVGPFEEAGIPERAHHDHRIDPATGEVIAFVDPEIERRQERIAPRLGYELRGHRLELHGVRRRDEQACPDHWPVDCAATGCRGRLCRYPAGALLKSPFRNVMELRAHTRKFIERDNRLAGLSFGTTFAVYFASLYLAITRADLWYVLIPAMIVHAFAAVRLYVLQHDCGHHSLFETRLQNEIAGHVLSPFTFAPFEVMKQNHNLHHANLGNLAHRETGEIHTMTLAEWNAAGPWERLAYRLYRNPFILIPVGAFYTYFIRYRWPKNTLRFGVVPVLLHNLAILAWVGLLWLWSGWQGLGIYFAASLLGGMIGVFLVYLQHNFEDTYWSRRPDLDPRAAALQGSSALDFGWWFDTAVACITLHDIHHFNARIPSYRLRKCSYTLPPEYAPRRIGFIEAVKALNLKLWDEETGRLVPFPRRERAARRAAA